MIFFNHNVLSQGNSDCAGAIGGWNSRLAQIATISGDKIITLYTCPESRVGIGHFFKSSQFDNPSKALHIRTIHVPSPVSPGPESHQGIRLENQVTQGTNFAKSVWDIEPNVDFTTFTTKLQFRNPFLNKTVMTLTDTGNVGIGTTNPIGKLEISTGQTIVRFGGMGGQDGIHHLSSSRDFVFNTFVTGNNPAFSFRKLSNFNDLSSYTDLVRITADGKVGIGTVSPFAKLHIKAVGNPIIGLQSDNFVVFGMQAVNDDRLRLGSLTGSNINDYLVIKKNGFVGIGTAAPNTKLHIKDAGNPIICLQSDNFAVFGIQAVNDDRLRLGSLTGSDINDYLVIKKNGYVGIGTSNPQNQLDVCGNIRAKKVRIETNWCDFVFDSEYNRMDWREKKDFYEINKHLPFISSSKEIESNGTDIGKEMTGILINVEENRLDITDLFIIYKELRSENKELKQKLESQQNELELLKERFEILLEQINRN